MLILRGSAGVCDRGSEMVFRVDAGGGVGWCVAAGVVGAATGLETYGRDASSHDFATA